MIVIRRTRPGRNNTVLATDTPLAEPVHFGRADTCGLRVLRAGVAFCHATLTRDGDAVRIEAAPETVLGPAGKPARSARLLGEGDSVRIGPCTLTLRAPASEGPVLELAEDPPTEETEEVRAERHFAAFDVRLPNVRLMGTALTCAILVLLFAFPLAFSPSAGSADAHQATALAALRRPAQTVWNVGQISRAHGGFGAECAFCHTAAFAHASQSSCLACHAGIGQHASPVLAPAADIEGVNCEHCHLEHKGPAMAVRNRQADCASCHVNIRAAAPHTLLRNVDDFSDGHPQFKAALVQDATLHRTARFEIGDEHAPDHSNLKFTHATHLKLAGLRAAGGGEACSLCHAPTPGGTSFKPVAFDTACASCHTLQFDPDHPQWRLPHGRADEVQSRVAGYYARAVLAGENFFQPPADLFRKPGAPPDPPRPAGAALVSAMTAQAMASSIARSACGECHTMMAAAPGTPEGGFTVAPVFVPDSYQPSTKFSHAAHATSSCSSCHAAKSSDGGPTALLPGISTCRNCHAGAAGAPQRVASDCAFCHRFHDAALPLASRVSAAELRR